MTNKERKLMFSITPDDCEMQTFRSGGSGGQNQNKRDTGVRYIHHPSGARGESREERSQLQNRKTAWRRMVENPKFTIWVHQALRKTDGIPSPEERVAKDLAQENNIKVEVQRAGKWVVEE
jgi:protein subunit release factor B